MAIATQLQKNLYLTEYKAVLQQSVSIMAMVFVHMAV
jgi:hypothetical protein